MSSGDTFHALLIGAGFAMFGTTEGPWNMTKRLEAKVGSRLVVDAIIEVDPPRAEAALSLKRDSSNAKAYKSTVILPNVEAFADKVKSGELIAPSAIFVATPPAFRGGLTAPRDLELQLMSYFPATPIFLEKPVATAVPWDESVGEAFEVAKRLKENHKGVVSIGYVLRYLKASQMIKKIIDDNGLHVMATFARWIMAYPPGIKVDWWTKSKSQGPCPRASHSCDLSRYFGGDVNVDTLSAAAVEWYEKPGELSQLQIDESQIGEDDRIPRFTTASWPGGAVGTMMHGVSLQGTNDSIELQVFADGYQFILSDPYGTPELRIRRPGSDESEIISTEGDDPYQTEMNHFIDAIEGRPEPSILSSYEDATKTYELTWAIRNASEVNSKKQLEKFGKGSA